MQADSDENANPKAAMSRAQRAEIIKFNRLLAKIGLPEAPLPLAEEDDAKYAKAQVTNGRLFADVDMRTKEGRRLRDITAGLQRQYGEDLSEMSMEQLHLMQRIAGLSVQVERMETEMGQGEPVDVERYGVLVGHLARAYDRLALAYGRPALDRRQLLDAMLDHLTYEQLEHLRTYVWWMDLSRKLEERRARQAERDPAFAITNPEIAAMTDGEVASHIDGALPEEIERLVEELF